METEYLQQHSKPTQSLASLVKMPVMKKSRGMGERQQLICKVAYELGIPAQYRSGLYFQTKEFTDKEIMNIRDQALSFKANPAALFRKLCKEHRLLIKEQLKMKEKMLNNSSFSKIFELQKTLSPALQQGKIYGIIGNMAWTPTDEDCTSGNMIPFSPELFNGPFFKQLK